MTAGEAITALQGSRDVEMVFYLYVIDARRHLVGVVSLRRLLLVSPDDAAQADHDDRSDQRPRRTWTRRKSRGMVASYNLLAIPVVDEENKLVGVITVDDVIDVIKDEATEDVYRLAGVTGDDRVFTQPVRVAAQAAAVAARQPRDGVPRGLGRRAVPEHDQRRDRAGGLHAGRRRHGRQRRDADADRDRPRHRARRADLEQQPQGAVQGGGGRAGQRRRLRAGRGAGRLRCSRATSGWAASWRWRWSSTCSWRRPPAR